MEAGLVFRAGTRLGVGLNPPMGRGSTGLGVSSRVLAIRPRVTPPCCCVSLLLTLFSGEIKVAVQKEQQKKGSTATHALFFICRAVLGWVCGVGGWGSHTMGAPLICVPSSR